MSGDLVLVDADVTTLKNLEELSTAQTSASRQPQQPQPQQPQVVDEMVNELHFDLPAMQYAEENPAKEQVPQLN